MLPAKNERSVIRHETFVGYATTRGTREEIPQVIS